MTGEKCRRSALTWKDDRLYLEPGRTGLSAGPASCAPCNFWHVSSRDEPWLPHLQYRLKFCLKSSPSEYLINCSYCCEVYTWHNDIPNTESKGYIRERHSREEANCGWDSDQGMKAGPEEEHWTGKCFGCGLLQGMHWQSGKQGARLGPPGRVGWGANRTVRPAGAQGRHIWMLKTFVEKPFLEDLYWKLMLEMKIKRKVGMFLYNSRLVRLEEHDGLIGPAFNIICQK